MSDQVNDDHRQLTIAIDHDGTFTEDRFLWVEFIRLARSRGHKVMCVTCRKETLENVEECDVPGVLTYFTGGAPKAWWMQAMHGIDVNVWIDDQPQRVHSGG
jgi:hypothetical protein